MRERRFTPLSKSRGQKVQGPSRLADLDGSRRPGEMFQMSKSKAPAPRFAPGQTVEYQGSTWTISHMFRLSSEPGVWRHTLMEIPKETTPESTSIQMLLLIAGAGKTTPRIVYEAFTREMDVHSFFNDIYLSGDCVTLTTQDMLSKAKVLS